MLTGILQRKDVIPQHRFALDLISGSTADRDHASVYVEAETRCHNVICSTAELSSVQPSLQSPHFCACFLIAYFCRPAACVIRTRSLRRSFGATQGPAAACFRSCLTTKGFDHQNPRSEAQLWRDAGTYSRVCPIKSVRRKRLARRRGAPSSGGNKHGSREPFNGQVKRPGADAGTAARPSPKKAKAKVRQPQKRPRCASPKKAMQRTGPAPGGRRRHRGSPQPLKGQGQGAPAPKKPSCASPKKAKVR